MLESGTKDETAREGEFRDFELDHKGDSANHLKRTRGHEKHLNKACALLWGRFQLSLCGMLKAQTVFEATVRSIPIKLLLAIKYQALD